MCPPHEFDVVSENPGFHIVRIDHVIGHQQELFTDQPVIVFLDDGGQFGNSPRCRVALQNQVQHSHEMAFAAAEAAMQVGGLAGATLHGTANENQCGIEAARQFRGDDIITQCLFSPIDTLGQPQHKVATLHAFRDVDEFFEQGHQIVRILG